MTEAEANILELLSIATDRTFTILQWWVSITIGLAAVGHFVGRQLNRGLAIVLLALYAAYTLYMAAVAVFNARISSNYVAALIELQESGTVLSPAGTAMTEGVGLDVIGIAGGIALLLSVIGAFIATVVYVGHAAFFKERRRT